MRKNSNLSKNTPDAKTKTRKNSDSRKAPRPPNVNLNLTVEEIAKKFGLVSTYETLEGWKRLSRKELLNLLKYSSVLAKDQGGCRLLQKLAADKDTELLGRIYDSSIFDIRVLMQDSFGNYLA